jgi:WhiB family redox-sensing transcriptional regulator
VTTSLQRVRWHPSDDYDDDARWRDDQDGGDRWRAYAACRDVNPELFFPEDAGGNEPATAPPEVKAICGRCPVAGRCLDRYIDEPDGVFAGTTGYERRVMTRKIMRKHCGRCRSTDVIKNQTQRKELCLACGWSWDLL